MPLTRRFERRKQDDIVRFCKHCKITNDDIPFLVQKNFKNGKFYIHSVCKACYNDNTIERRSIYYNENKETEIDNARKWNEENRERYNKRRRKTFMEKWCR